MSFVIYERNDICWFNALQTLPVLKLCVGKSFRSLNEMSNIGFCPNKCCTCYICRVKFFRNRNVCRFMQIKTVVLCLSQVGGRGLQSSILYAAVGGHEALPYSIIDRAFHCCPAFNTVILHAGSLTAGQIFFHTS